jgi:LDH2 family malate/lactate/ureidoglycolate dehydrogenase
MSPREIRACVQEMIDAERRGKPAFGIVLVPHILKWHQRKRGEPEVFDRGPAAAFIEGQDTVGPLVAEMAMDLAMDKARTVGLGLVAIRNHTPWLLASYHPRRAAEAGLIGATWSVGVSIAAPYGGRRPVFGTNPLGIAIPAEGGPIVLDMACTRGPATALRGPGPMPPGLAVDAAGEPTTDPAAARKGALLVFGEHKGSGLAMMVELLAGAWVGAKTGSRQPGPRGAVFLAAQTDLFGFGDGFPQRAETLAAEIRAAAGDEGPFLHVPGRREDSSDLPPDLLEVDADALAELKALAGEAAG